MRDMVEKARAGERDAGRWLLAGLIAAVLAGGCAATGNPPATATPTPGPTATPAATPAPTPTPFATLAPTSAPASQVAALRCAETPNAAPSATVQWTRGVPMGAEPTIKAGQAVAFVTTGASPTVTEWINGTPAASPCIDKAIGSDTTNGMSVVVTFYQPGDYNITCRVIPLEMHTIVHVK
jgi:plastocyanin